MTATHVSEMFPLEDLIAAIDDGLVSVQSHPTLPLLIHNYSPECQYSRSWSDVTRACRGLILDEDGYVVARPFPKFHNWSETDMYDSIPPGDPIVSEKMDGSLGIIYTYNGEVAVATRGSFASDQALWATDYLNRVYPDFEQWDGATTLVEIIYPANRIVVDYADDEGLVLLGAIWNGTGVDIPILDVCYWTGRYWDGPVAEHYLGNTVESAVALATGEEFEEAEGVVLCWPRKDGPSFRLKIKHPRYIELHRIVTNLSTRSVHEALSNGTFDKLIAVTPDEFHPWVRQVRWDLDVQFREIFTSTRTDLVRARVAAQAVAEDFGGSDDYTYLRKDLAREIQSCAKYPGLCFALEDGKDISSRIWDMIKPEREMAVILEDS